MSDRARTRRAIQAERRARAKFWRWFGAGVAIVASVGVAVALTASGEDRSPSATASGPEGQLALGATVFEASCATCHGDDLMGTFVGPPLVDEIYAPDHHDDDAIRAAIANGVQPHHWDFSAMPPISGVDAAEADAVIAHIRAVQEAEGIGAATP